jgi:hypothetical protein
MRFVPTPQGWLNLQFVSTICQNPEDQHQLFASDDTGRRELVVSAMDYPPFYPEPYPRSERRFIEIENDAGQGRCFLAVERVREIIRDGDRFVAIDDADKRHAVTAGEAFGGLLAGSEKGGAE